MYTLGTGAAQLDILFQIGSVRTINVNFGQDISGWTFEFYLKENKGSRVKKLSLVSGIGITSPVYGEEEIDINFASADTKLQEGQYYYELRRTDLNVPLLNGFAYLSFDAPDGDLYVPLTFTLGNDSINLTVQTGSSGSGGGGSIIWQDWDASTNTLPASPLVGTFYQATSNSTTLFLPDGGVVTAGIIITPKVLNPGTDLTVKTKWAIISSMGY